MFVVTFKLQGSPGKLVEIRKSLHGIATKVKKMDECRDTKVYQDLDDKNIFFWFKSDRNSGCWTII
jgi:quinol monooxygenase YgiN